MPARHKGARRPWAIAARLAGSGLLFALIAALPAKADYAVLRSGQRLHIAGWQILGDKVRLDMKGGSLTIDAAELARVEPEDVFGESAKTELDVSVPYADQIQNSAHDLSTRSRARRQRHCRGIEFQLPSCLQEIGPWLDATASGNGGADGRAERL